MEKIIYIRQKRGTSHTTPKQRAILKALGVCGIGTKVFRKDTRSIRGMLNFVQHLIEAELVDSSFQKAAEAKKVSKAGYTIG